MWTTPFGPGWDTPASIRDEHPGKTQEKTLLPEHRLQMEAVEGSPGNETEKGDMREQLWQLIFQALLPSPCPQYIKNKHNVLTS
jgi:hypothetical protein